MAYAQLNSPLPSLTLPFHPGAHAFLRDCVHCDLGDDSLSYPPLIDPTMTDLPLPTPTDTSTILSPMNPPMNTDVPWIGDIFQNVGPDEYLNIQTGQVVPGSIASEVIAATSGASSIAQTTGTEPTATLVDPTTGETYSGTLTHAAQALKSAGTLVDGVGHLTAQGRALAAVGQLISAPVTPTGGSSISSAVSSLTSWFTQKTLFSSVPNYLVVGGVAIGLFVIAEYSQGHYVVRSKKTGKTLYRTKAHIWD
jgi:hypothetical protein